MEVEGDVGLLVDADLEADDEAAALCDDDESQGVPEGDALNDLDGVTDADTGALSDRVADFDGVMDGGLLTDSDAEPDREPDGESVEEPECVASHGVPEGDALSDRLLELDSEVDTDDVALSERLGVFDAALLTEEEADTDREADGDALEVPECVASQGVPDGDGLSERVSDRE